MGPLSLSMSGNWLDLLSKELKGVELVQYLHSLQLDIKGINDTNPLHRGTYSTAHKCPHRIRKIFFRLSGKYCPNVWYNFSQRLQMNVYVEKLHFAFVLQRFS